jgi:heat shock protein HslJ
MRIDRTRPLIRAMLLAAIVAVLAACTSGGASPSASGGGGELIGPTWQWSASTTTAPVSQSVVPNPENYTIQFAEDGTFSAKADCNQLSGGYETDDAGALTITPGPMTLALCPAESLSDLYVASLGMTQSYEINADGQLVLTTSDGTLTFDS